MGRFFSFVSVPVLLIWIVGWGLQIMRVGPKNHLSFFGIPRYK